MHKYSQKQKGLAAIELTLMLPFLLLLIFATAEMGRMLYQYSALNKSIRSASRYLMSNAQDGTTGNILLTDAVQTTVEQIVVYGAQNTNAVLLPNLDASTINISVSGDFLTVTVVYPWQPIFADSLSLFGLGDDIDLSFNLNAAYTTRALL